MILQKYIGQHTVKIFLITAIFFLALFTRYYKLDYSNFQGDEAVIVSTTDYNFKDFRYILKNQFKGPGEYMTAYIAKKLPLNDIELKFRFPFFIASIVYVILFLYTVINIYKENFFIASIIFLFSGLILSLSRIAQYQSFVLLFSLFITIQFNKYIDTRKMIYLYITGLAIAIGSFYHFDVLLLFAVISIFLLINKNIKDLILFSLFTISVTLAIWTAFYPLSSILTMINYILTKRLSNADFTDNFTYSVTLLNLYHTKEYLFITASLLLLYLYKQSKSIMLKMLLVLLLISLLLRIVYAFDFYIGYIATIILFVLFTYFYLSKNRRSLPHKELFINIYFLGSFALYFLIMQKPLTHIYNVIFPAAIICGLSFKYIHSWAKLMLLIIISASTLSFYYVVYANSDNEYPFDDENYIFGQLKSIEDKKLDGVFGFLYFRDYDKIANEMNKFDSNIKNYQSNEKSKITDYYLKSFIRSNDLPYYYVDIYKPQSQDKPSIDKSSKTIYKGEKYEIFLIK